MSAAARTGVPRRRRWALGALVLAVPAAYLAGCDSPPPPTRSTPIAPPAAATASPTAAGAATERAVGTTLPYALDSRRNTWPPIAKGTGSSAVDAHLLRANYYVVLDGSGSMNETGCSGGSTKIEAARAALASFAASVPADASLGLLAFDKTGVSERVPLGTGNREQFARVVSEVDAGSGTPLARAVRTAYLQLTEQARRQLGYGEYNLVVVTDGHASGGQDPTKVINHMLHESPVALHTVGFCISERHALNQPGRAYYRAASNPGALREGLDAVLAEAPSFDVTQFSQ